MSLNVPKELIVGLPAKWEASHATYKSDVYNLVFGIAGPASIAVMTTPQDNGNWLVEIDGVDIVELGAYAWAARVADESDNYIPIGAGTISVVADLTAVDTPYDPRSANEKTLDNIKSAIASLVEGKPVQKYKIEGREAEYIPLADLRELQNYYQRLVNNEKAAQNIANGGASTRVIRSRFSAQY